MWACPIWGWRSSACLGEEFLALILCVCVCVYVCTYVCWNACVCSSESCLMRGATVQLLFGNLQLTWTKDTVVVLRFCVSALNLA